MAVIGGPRCRRWTIDHAFWQRSFFAPVNDEHKSINGKLFAAVDVLVLQIADAYYVYSLFLPLRSTAFPTPDLMTELTDSSSCLVPTVVVVLA